MLKIDFENQILALFDVYFWPFNKSHEKINTIFVISSIIASIWNVFIKFHWHDEKLTRRKYTQGLEAPSFSTYLLTEVLLSHHRRSSLYIEICLDSFLLIHITHEFFQFSHWIGMDFLRSFSNFGLNILCWVTTHQRFFLRSLEKRLIFCFNNCSVLLWRKNCSSVILKFFWVKLLRSRSELRKVL